MYNTIGLLLFCIGIILINLHFINNNTQTKEKIIYRYIPRSLKEEQKEPISVSEIFGPMFNQPSTWIGGLNDLDTRKRESINQYFISQQ
jgi:hypothetical protein